MKNIKTNYSSPKTNIFSALWSLRSALASGNNARLIRMKNEDCEHPIKVRHEDNDFRNYEFQIGLIRTMQEVLDDQNESEFSKHLTLNYSACYGTKEAVERYYKTGQLSMDNFKGIGVSHLVKVDDIIRFWKTHPDVKMHERAESYIYQYKDPKSNYRGFYDMYKYKHGSPWAVKQFKRKLWVVELLDGKPAKVPVAIRILNVLAYPLKFIPKKSVLRTNNNTKYTFRIGDLIHGFQIEFQIPKKFSF